MIFSPLRYPGGKAKLYPFFVRLIEQNLLFDCTYCEPYAGGAGLALKLLCNGFVERIKLNDIDVSIYCFWHSILNYPNKFCDEIDRTPITIDEWHRQKAIWKKCDKRDSFALGFATYFLNRTNRSGIIEGAGPIGGFDQTGNFKIDARFNKDMQANNIVNLSRFKNQIELSNIDALNFIDDNISGENCFMYLDPPYYVKGKNLYKNFYGHSDHEQICKKLELTRNAKWVVSYDDVPEIRQIYSAFTPTTYSLNYSAANKGIGSEVIYVSDCIDLPVFEGFNVAA